MEGESILEIIYDDEPLDFQDVDMVDAEEGQEQLLDVESLNGDSDGVQVLAQEQTLDINAANGDNDDAKQVSQKSRRRRKNRRKKKSSRSSSDVKDINRFVVDTCRCLQEKKSYLVWAAVGCLGVSSLRDLVKEVETIQACGGQMTANGIRFRTGGGVLWNILKSREPKAYKEIMVKGKEFEKQFRQQCYRQFPMANKEPVTEKPKQQLSDGDKGQVCDSSQPLETQNEQAHRDTCEGRISALRRIRAPVTYGDLFDEPSKDEAT